ACLALLAAIGIWTLGRLALDRLFAGGKADVWTVVPIQGDGDGLDQTVRRSIRRPHSRGVLLVDCGLNDQGRALADFLTKQEPNVWLCTWEQAGTWMKEADVWTKQKSVMK
ncbi:MAG: hypothetical protein ACI4O3_00065, partial [Oscillospiraceae bacterium]